MQHPEWLSAAIAEGKRFHFQKKNPWLHNALNLGLLASLLGASTGVFWLGSVTPSLPYLLVAPFALGLVFFALFILVVHEAAHGMFVISRDRKRALFYNRLFGWFVSLIIAVDYTRHWEIGHHTHHLRPIEPDDPQATNRLTGRLLLRKCVAYLLIPGYIVYDRLGGSVAKKKTPST